MSGRTFNYDRLMTILGVQNDERYRLFFSVLKARSKAASSANNSFTNIGSIDLNNDPVFKEINTKSPDNVKHFIGSLGSLTNPINTTAGTPAGEALRQLTSVDTNNFSNDSFQVALLKNITNLPDNNSNWGTVNSVTLNEAATANTALGWLASWISSGYEAPSTNLLVCAS